MFDVQLVDLDSMAAFTLSSFFKSIDVKLTKRY